MQVIFIVGAWMDIFTMLGFTTSFVHIKWWLTAHQPYEVMVITLDQVTWITARGVVRGSGGTQGGGTQMTQTGVLPSEYVHRFSIDNDYWLGRVEKTCAESKQLPRASCVFHGRHLHQWLSLVIINPHTVHFLQRRMGERDGMRTCVWPSASREHLQSFLCARHPVNTLPVSSQEAPRVSIALSHNLFIKKPEAQNCDAAYPKCYPSRRSASWSPEPSFQSLPCTSAIEKNFCTCKAGLNTSKVRHRGHREQSCSSNACRQVVLLR